MIPETKIVILDSNPKNCKPHQKKNMFDTQDLNENSNPNLNKVCYFTYETHKFVINNHFKLSAHCPLTQTFKYNSIPMTTYSTGITGVVWYVELKL